MSETTLPQAQGHPFDWRVWWRLARPFTLTASIVPVLVGSAVAPADAQGAVIRVMRDRWQVWARRWLGSRPQLPALFVVDRDGTVRATVGACGREAVASLGAAIERAFRGG